MNPTELAERRVRLSAEYSRMSEELGDILTIKASKWAEYRSTVKSDKAADRIWDATDGGLREMRLRLKLKAYEKQMSSIKTMVDVLTGEARNQW